MIPSISSSPIQAPLKSRTSTATALKDDTPSRTSSSESLTSLPFAAGSPTSTPTMTGTPNASRPNSGVSASPVQTKAPSPLAVDTSFEMLESNPMISTITLQSVRAINPTISAVFEKLNSGSTSTLDTSTSWKPRLFVFDTTDANLYLFKLNAQPDSLPVTFLPVLDCRGFMDTFDGKSMVQVSGTGQSAEGDVVRRSWTLRFSDEETFSIWLKTIKRSLIEKESSSSVWGLSPPMSRSRSTRSIYVANNVLPTRKSVDRTRSASLGSNRSANGRNQDELHQEYVALYKKLDAIAVPEAPAKKGTFAKKLATFFQF
ncbi:UNVERIFIED_CONTAM: hypothetical protein HDU68_012082 [Siphonaria sp. JEL0065]|nr:hypothetical protein HDU68_012082 [Siphonaria sp. JEL0065]